MSGCNQIKSDGNHKISINAPSLWALYRMGSAAEWALEIVKRN